MSQRQCRKYCKWARSPTWQNTSSGKLGAGEKRQVVCFAGEAESRSNVHLLWQTETTGPAHSGSRPSAQIRVKREVEESSSVCARAVCLCVNALPQVAQAWIKLFSSFHFTSLHLDIVRSKRCASVSAVLSGSWNEKRNEKKMPRWSRAWRDSWNWLVFLSITSISHSLKHMEIWEESGVEWTFTNPDLHHSGLIHWDIKHNPSDITSSQQAEEFRMTPPKKKHLQGTWTAWWNCIYLYTEVYQDVNVGSWTCDFYSTIFVEKKQQLARATISFYSSSLWWLISWDVLSAGGFHFSNFFKRCEPCRKTKQKQKKIFFFELKWLFPPAHLSLGMTVIDFVFVFLWGFFCCFF